MPSVSYSTTESVLVVEDNNWTVFHEGPFAHAQSLHERKLCMIVIRVGTYRGLVSTR